MVGHIHIMIIELLMKLDVILKNVGCTVTKMLDHNMKSCVGTSTLPRIQVVFLYSVN